MITHNELFLIRCEQNYFKIKLIKNDEFSTYKHASVNKDDTIWEDFIAENDRIRVYEKKGKSKIVLLKG
jgi:hypothetical protein